MLQRRLVLAVVVRTNLCDGRRLIQKLSGSPGAFAFLGEVYRVRSEGKLWGVGD